MLVIRLSRTGRKKQPTYRVVVAEHSAPIKGRFLEVLGHYNPRTKDLVLNEERAKLRLSHGAKPSETAEALLEKAGVLKRGKIIRRPERQKRKDRPTEGQVPEAAPKAASPKPSEGDDKGGAQVDSETKSPDKQDQPKPEEK